MSIFYDLGTPFSITFDQPSYISYPKSPSYYVIHHTPMFKKRKHQLNKNLNDKNFRKKLLLRKYDKEVEKINQERAITDHKVKALELLLKKEEDIIKNSEKRIVEIQDALKVLKEKSSSYLSKKEEDLKQNLKKSMQKIEDSCENEQTNKNNNITNQSLQFTFSNSNGWKLDNKNDPSSESISLSKSTSDSTLEPFSKSTPESPKLSFQSDIDDNNSVSSKSSKSSVYIEDVEDDE